jgi:hypothetical protein
VVEKQQKLRCCGKITTVAGKIDCYLKRSPRKYGYAADQRIFSADQRIEAAVSTETMELVQAVKIGNVVPLVAA